MTCKVTASREALAARRARESLGWPSVGRGTAALMLLLVGNLLLLLAVRVFGRLGNVVVVVEHGHRGLHLRGRGIPHAVHVLGRHGWVRGKRLLRLLRRVARRV